MTLDLTHARYLAAVDEQMSSKHNDVMAALLEYASGTLFQMLTPQGLLWLSQYLETNHLTSSDLWGSLCLSEADDEAKEVLKQLYGMTLAAKSGFLELLITELVGKGMQPKHICPIRLVSK